MIANKEDFLKTLTDEQLNAGYLKFNIPDEDKTVSDLDLDEEE